MERCKVNYQNYKCQKDYKDYNDYKYQKELKDCDECKYKKGYKCYCEDEEMTHVHEYESSVKLAEEGCDRHNHRAAGVTLLSYRSEEHTSELQSL